MNNVNKIKFITIFITFILLSFLLTGCSEKYQDLRECLEVNLSEISINNYTASVTEDGDNIFYVSHDGIYKIGKKSLVKERICKTEAPQNLDKSSSLTGIVRICFASVKMEIKKL